MSRAAILSLLAVTLVGCGQIANTPPPKISDSKESAVIGTSGPRHPVTEKMGLVADKQTAGVAPMFKLKDPDGKTIDTEELLKSGPIVVISILDGCPCSIDSQPLFNGLSKKFAGKATFIGLFNTHDDGAKDFVKDNSIPYPVVVNADLSVYKAYKAERSVYVTLVAKDGKIVKQWPGYWIDMLKELDTKLGEQTGFAGEPFDPAYAPKEKSSGCMVYEGEGYTQGDAR